MVFEYILSNPSYLVILLTSLLAVVLLVVKIHREMKKDDDEDQDGGDGGISLDFDPDLDLPPGVSLPVDGPKKQEPVLA